MIISGLTQFYFGLILAAIISVLAYRLKALNRSGALAATISGGIIFGLGGVPWASLLLLFFISSSILSRSFAHRKAQFNEKYSKGSQRDWGQVTANGGLGAMIVLLYGLVPDLEWLWIAYAGAMAAVNADTWATELGVLNPYPPRLITNGRIVERGASGGISLLGSLAAIAGAGLVATCALLITPQATQDRLPMPVLLFAVTLGGVAGSFFDSFLGAAIQAIYYCPLCRKETERYPRHLCGTQTSHIRGWQWLNNDLVNFFASLAGALVASGIWWLMH